jgi:hypothetical protein
MSKMRSPQLKGLVPQLRKTAAISSVKREMAVIEQWRNSQLRMLQLASLQAFMRKYGR